MAKIVYNGCHGGFGLSEAAVMRYAELKGLILYPEQTSIFTRYWRVPAERRICDVGSEWAAMSTEERQAHNDTWSEQTFDPKALERNDPFLVQVVEELGGAASGRFANLQIYELPDGTLYRIDEYDGFESVETQADIDWKVA